MNGKKKAFVIIGALLVGAMLTAGVSMLHAHFGSPWGPGCGNPEERAAWICERLTKRLELNDVQRQDLEAMVAELGGKRKEMEEFHARTRDEVLGILREENSKPNRAQQMVAEHKQVIGDLMTYVSDRLITFVGTLSPEQRTRLAEAIEEHSACFHGHGR